MEIHKGSSSLINNSHILDEHAVSHIGEQYKVLELDDVTDVEYNVAMIGAPLVNKTSPF